MGKGSLAFYQHTTCPCPVACLLGSDNMIRLCYARSVK
jgi:hypothetical protein